MQLINRRRFLHGLSLSAGGAFMIPWLRSMRAQAEGAPTTARLVLLISGGGLPATYRPTAGADPTQFTLPPAFADFEPQRDQLTFVDGLYNPFNHHLHGAGWSTLTCVPSTTCGAPGQPECEEDALPGGQSFDRLVGTTLGAEAPVSSLNLMLAHHSETLGYSSDGVDRVFPLQSDPRTVFESLFDASMGEPGQALERTERRLSVLDFARQDIQRVQARLGPDQRPKLEQYLESVRGLERQLSDLAGIDCGAVEPPAVGDLDHGAPPRPEVIDAHIDLTATALACGLTRVATLVLPEMELPFLDGGPGFHGMWHGDGTDQLHTTYYRYIHGRMLAIQDALAAVPEGTGTVADQTLIVNINANGGGHHHGYNDVYLTLLGSVEGAIRSGQLLTYQTGEHCISDAFVGIAHAMGMDLETFGHPAHNRGPLPGLL